MSLSRCNVSLEIKAFSPIVVRSGRTLTAPLVQRRAIEQNAVKCQCSVRA